MSLLQQGLRDTLCRRMYLWRCFISASMKPWHVSCLGTGKETLISMRKLHTGTKFLPNKFTIPQSCRNISSFTRNTSYLLVCQHRFLKCSNIAAHIVRLKSSMTGRWGQRNRTVMMYVLAGAILVVGFSYAAVPLYTVFCQATGLGGEVKVGHDTDKVETMHPVAGRPLLIRFNADTAASMRWNFKPQQTEIKVFPGETALAFYSAINPTDKPIIGISTYNVVPFDAGQYFNKIQCFCFEEQRLNPHEQVDMPVFFYIDPEFADDPKMQKVDTITLSYTFFEAKEGLVLPDPYAKT